MSAGHEAEQVPWSADAAGFGPHLRLHRAAGHAALFDGLALATTQLLGQDPRSGALFVFLNKRSTQARVLWWDTNGYCLLSKRLHQALFVMPSTP